MIGALGMAVLTLGAGFCLFDGAHNGPDDHGRSLDLRLVVLAALTLPLLTRLPETGEAPVAARTLVVLVVPSVPAPPPKLAPSA
jgi:hypothetical protein